MSKHILKPFIFIGVALASACVHGPTPSENEAKVLTSKNAPKSSANQNPEPRIVLKPEQCYSLKKDIQAPAFIRAGQSGFFITRFLKPCITRDGQRGIEKESAWMAMGIPCTGGHGKIQLKRPVYAPKLVTFQMRTECPMQPADLEQLKVLAKEELGLTEDFPLIAYNPMSIQYWEMSSLTETDVGDSLYLSSVASRTNAWPKFLTNTPIPVRIYGRENAWVQGNFFYELEIDLYPQGNSGFRVEVRSGKILSNDEIGIVKMRCTTRTPAINCNEIF